MQLSLASKGAQTHIGSYYSGGAPSIFNETGALTLINTRVQALGTSTASLASVSGQTSVESGGTLALDATSLLVGTTDLSIIQGQGDITVNPITASRGTLAWSQIGVNRNLTLATRNGSVNFTGSPGSNGVGSSSKVGLYVRGDFNLIGNNVNLRGARLQTGGALNITATTGDLTTQALQANQTAAGYSNTYWDYVQLMGDTGVNVRAAGNIAMDSVYAKSNGAVNIQAGGNTTIAGNYAHYTVNNQPGGGWYQDERYLLSVYLKSVTFTP